MGGGADGGAGAAAAATRNAEARGAKNVTFRVGDPVDLTFDRPFDAAVGRYVLLFQPDPAAVIGKLAAKVRAGGVLAFHEPDLLAVRSFPPAPLYDRCAGWIRETFRKTGANTRMSEVLHGAFVRAGLPAPTMRMETFIGGGAESAVFLLAVAELVASIVPEMERLGIATAREVDEATLFERMRREVEATDSVIVGRSEVGAWCRTA